MDNKVIRIYKLMKMEQVLSLHMEGCIDGNEKETIVDILMQVNSIKIAFLREKYIEKEIEDSRRYLADMAQSRSIVKKSLYELYIGMFEAIFPKEQEND